MLTVVLFWWKRVDSDHRSETQQIYSLPPLATRERFLILSSRYRERSCRFLSSTQYINCLQTKKWSWWTDSNPRPADYKSAALPTELHQRSLLNYYITTKSVCQVILENFLDFFIFIKKYVKNSSVL